MSITRRNASLDMSAKAWHSPTPAEFNRQVRRSEIIDRLGDGNAHLLLLRDVRLDELPAAIAEPRGVVQCGTVFVVHRKVQHADFASALEQPHRQAETETASGAGDHSVIPIFH